MATGPKETTRSGGGDRKTASPKKFVLPTIPTSAQLLEAVQRLTPAEAQQALRHRIAPISWEPGKLSYVAAGERAKAYATEQGLEVSAITNERTMLQALQAGQESELVNHAVWGLKNRLPKHSAAQAFTAQQALWLALGLALVAFGVMWDRPTAAVVAFAVMLALFALAAGLNIWCLLPAKLPQAPPAVKVADDELPVYSVLVPVLRETKVADQLVQALRALDYPPGKLDIKLILEAEDQAARKFFDDLRLPSHMEVIVVPKGELRTRHKALNFALPFVRGELVAVYDADSLPANDQLRRVAGAFSLAPKTVACLQTQVGYYNRNENWLTRQCALDYSFQFKLLFPRLAKFGSPLLFAGASTHYRTALLRQAGAFDAHNVARDSGLGVRLARLGFRTALVPTLTREEAPCRLLDWLRQRVRWIKGALQTAIVNTRAPVRMWRELGGRNFLLTQAFTGGTIIVALLHPFFLAWLATVSVLVILDKPAGGQLWLFLLALYGMVTAAAFLLAMACTLRASLYLGRGISWGTVILTAPVYWLMVSVATWLAVLQYFTAAHRWAKTPHGVTRVKPQVAPTSQQKAQAVAEKKPSGGAASMQKPQFATEKKPSAGATPLKKPQFRLERKPEARLPAQKPTKKD